MIAVPFSRRQVAASFTRSAASYDAAAVLQAEVGSRLAERLELTTLAPQGVLDLGCGTGRMLPRLARIYPRAMFVAADIAAAMLARASDRPDLPRHCTLVCADAEHLPFADAAFDLVFSNLTLQWCPDPEQAFREARRVLAERALYLFTTFGPDTLGELRAAWSGVDEYTHVNPFYDMHDLGDALIRAGFVEPVMDVEYLTLTYADVRSLMRDLKAIGAHNLNADRSHGLTGRGRLAAMEAAYERFRTSGRLPATYEVIYGTAWTPVWLPRRGER